MKIFSMPDHQKSLIENESGKFWFSFSSFNMIATDLKNQEMDISRTKDDFENCSSSFPFIIKRSIHEKTERMV